MKILGVSFFLLVACLIISVTIDMLARFQFLWSGPKQPVRF